MFPKTVINVATLGSYSNNCAKYLKQESRLRAPPVQDVVGGLGERDFGEVCGYNNLVDFAWDPEKAAANLEKHSVSFEEARTVFDDPLAATFEDEAHSEAELREFLVGHSAHGRLLLVCFTERRQGIRVISARQVTRQERQDYERNPTL